MVTLVHLKKCSLVYSLLLFFLVLTSSCTLLTSVHKTYLYNVFSSPISKAHIGDHFTLIWKPQQGTDSTAASPMQD